MLYSALLGCPARWAIALLETRLCVALSDDGVWLLSVWRLSVAYIGPKSRTERPRKTKIGTEVAHITRDSDTTLKAAHRHLARQAAAAVGVGTCCTVLAVGKLLLRCRLLGGARRFGVHGERRGAGTYRGGRPPTACYVCIVIAFAFGEINILLLIFFYLYSY